MPSKSPLFFFLFLFLLLIGNICFSQNDSTIKRQMLKPVDVLTRQQTPTNSSAHLQVITADQLHTMPIIQASDALKFMSGITVRDYGGIGGIKTVSVRGFGANHTGVVYDGISVSDCQTGQIDLGKFYLENVETLSLTTGSPDDIFIPARLVASANLIQMKTKIPVFDSIKPYNLSLQFTTGSFGLINPVLYFENRITKPKELNRNIVTSSLLVNYMRSNGRYPFTLSYGNSGDSTSREWRNASEVQSLNAEANLYVHFTPTSRLQFKTYYFGSERELPGAVIFYNTRQPQKLWDQNFFFQLHYEYLTSPKYHYQTNAKFNYAYQRYLDNYFLNEQGFIDNNYIQYEYYVSNVFLYKPLKTLAFSFSNDLIYNEMESNMDNFVYPNRFSSLSTLALNFKTKYVSIMANVLHTFVDNNCEFGEPAVNVNRFSPSFCLMVCPTDNQQIRLRAFYKNIFRLPTFNDLYYREVGNVSLKPENTHQLDAGVIIEHFFPVPVINLLFTADLYYNVVYDKIVTIPSKNLFNWMMLNYGEVRIEGFDINANIKYRISSLYTLELMGNYTYQRAIDVTDVESKTYKHQLPYTPVHSGSVAMMIKTKWIDLTYSLLASGKRYSLQQNINDNLLSGYVEQSIGISHSFDLKSVNLDLKAELINLANCQYEVIRNYPMPGRSIRFSLRMIL